MPGSGFECMLGPELGSLIVDQYVGDTDEHGCYSGRGEASFRRSGNTYTGEFRRGAMDGRGQYVWASDGTIYEGDFSKNELVGIGRYIWSNGSSYEGGVSNGLRNGKGAFTSEDGTLVYEGFWKDGKRHGHGVQRYGVGTSSVSTYVGEWQENLRHGRGTMTYASGNEYEGDWVEDRKEGEGIMTWVHRRERYTGEWKADQQHGYGEHVWIEDRPNNPVALDTQKQMCNVYRGQWLDGMRQGEGTFLYADSSRYVGYWLKNKKHGPAVFTSANGSTFEGRFEDDFMVGNMFQDHDHPELSSAIKLSITDIIHCGHDAHTTRAIVREVERSALQINSDLRLAYKLYAKAGANAPRDSNMFTMSLQQFVVFARNCRALTPCTSVTAAEVYRMFSRMRGQHAWELTSSLTRVLRKEALDGEDISAACFGRQAGSGLNAWLTKRDAEDEIYDPRKAITFREFVEGVVRLASMIGDMSFDGGARFFSRAKTELSATPPSTAAQTLASRVTNSGSNAATRSPKLQRVGMAPVEGEGFMTGNTCAEECLADNTDATAEISVNDHLKRFVNEHLRGLCSVLVESPGSCSGSVTRRGVDRVGSKEAVRFGSGARGKRWEVDDVVTEGTTSKAEELECPEAQVKHLYSMYSGPLHLMTLRGLLRMLRDADLKRRAGLTSAEVKEVFSQANASLKSPGGAESQSLIEISACIYKAPSEDVEGSSDTSDSTGLAEPGHSTTTPVPAVDLELLDQELMPDQFKIVVAELFRILRVKATTPAPLVFGYDGPAAGVRAGRCGGGTEECANVTESELESGKHGSRGSSASETEKVQEEGDGICFTMKKKVSSGGKDQSQPTKPTSPSKGSTPRGSTPGYREEPPPCPPWLANPHEFVSQVSAWAEKGSVKRVTRVALRPVPNRNFALHITLERAFRQQSYGKQ